jgi:uridine kinase
VTLQEPVVIDLATRLAATRVDHPLRVAIDGVTAAGKSTFAHALTGAVNDAGRPAVHLSTDDYHHQRARRRRHPDPAAGYYRDAYDLDAFRERVLLPLGPGGDRRYQPRRHDLETDEILPDELVTAQKNEIVIVDGTFLQRAELAGHWDVVVWLDTSFELAVRRAMVRDEALFGGREQTRTAYETRYHAACRRYLAEVRPVESADLVVDNN